jgi:3-(3-hydroxy-phenyl)propionate hydroxylase
MPRTPVTEASKAGDRRRIVVVGAGPVGLAAALALRAVAVRVVVLEAEREDRCRPGSRAIYVHGTTLAILERLHPGLGKWMAARGIVWPTRRTLWRGREVFHRTYDRAADSRLPHFTSLPQTEVEALLLRACLENGVDVLWGARVSGVESTSGGVTIALASGESMTADFVIGADGARSTVRESIGVELEGSRSANSYVIVDVAEDAAEPRPIERIFHYEHPAVGGRNVLLVPFAGGWRADLQCDEDDDPEEFAGETGAAAWVASTLGERYGDRITWVSTYQFLQVVAQSFVDASRRVLLVGEAAHLFAPFGARGMNSGIADADRAASAIGVAFGASDRAAACTAIDEFERERRAAAEWNCAAAGEALAHLRARSAWSRAKRTAAALAAPWWPGAGQWLDTAPYGPSGAPSAARSKY